MNHTPDNSDWLDELDEPEASYWDPDPGDTVVGRLVSVGTETGKYNPHDVAYLETEDALVAVRIQHTILIDKWKEKRPRVGDQVAIRYLEPVTAKSGKTFFKYKLVVNRADTNVVAQDYDDVEPPTEEETSYDPETQDPWASQPSDPDRQPA